MKKNIFLLIILVVITVLAFLIAIPTIEFKVDNTDYKIRGLDPKDFNQSFITEYFAMQPSIDLQGGSLITLNVDLTSKAEDKREEELNKVKSAIYWRLWNAKINDFQLNVLADKNGAKNKIVIKAPQFIDQKLVELLLTPANLSVWVQDPNASTSGVTPTPGQQDAFKQIFGERMQAAITNEDVESVSIVSDARCYFSDPKTPKNYCINIIIKPESRIKLASAINAVPSAQTRLPLVIALDFSPIGVQAGGQRINSLDPAAELLIYPLVDDKAVVNAIIGAMIESAPMSSDVKFESIQKLNPIMGDNTMNALKVSLSLSFVAVIALIIYYFKKRGVLFAIVYSVFVIWSIAIFKMTNISLNFAFIGGFVSASIVFVSLLISAEYKIRSAYKGALTSVEMKEIYNAISIKFRNLTIAMIVLNFVMDMYGTQLTKNFVVGLAGGIVVGLLVILSALKILMPYLLLNKKH